MFIKGIFTLNIGTILFTILLVYMSLCAIIYFFSDRTISYQVIAGPLSRNETYTGLAIRAETTYRAESSGYINYYAREGSKTQANGIVYGLSSTKAPETKTELTPEELTKIRNQMLSFSKGFNSSKFNSTYSFKYELEGTILQYSGITEDVVLPSENLENPETSQTEKTENLSAPVVLGNQTLYKAESDGIILYSKDGYETKTIETLTTDDFNQNAYQETDLKTKENVKAGDPLYTLITDERWSLLIPLTDKQAIKLAGRASVRVKFLKDDTTQVGDFSIIEIEEKKYGKIDFNKGLIRYASDRFLEIELVTNTVSGLKIPLTSIVTKEFYVISSDYVTKDETSQEIGFTIEVKAEDGKMVPVVKYPTIYAKEEIPQINLTGEEQEPKYLYYIDKSVFQEGQIIIQPKDGSQYMVKDVGILEGVYCINKGYAVFRKISILDQNEEYAIISSNTTYGLSLYDYIAKNTENVKEEDILY